MSQFRKVATWTSKIVILLSTTIYTMISIQPLFQPAASAAAQGMVFTSAVGVTIFRVSFAGLPLGCAAFLVYCLLSKGRAMDGSGLLRTVTGDHARGKSVRHGGRLQCSTEHAAGACRSGSRRFYAGRDCCGGESSL